MTRKSLRMRYGLLIAIASLATQAPLSAAEPVYQNDFEQVEAGSESDDFLIIDGAFTVKEEGGNKFLELPGAPLDSFSAMFGPSAKEDVGVSARILGTRKGRRYPTFGVALNGLGGYKLRVSPGKRELELYRGDEVKQAVPLKWESGKWTFLKLELTTPAEGKWLVEGKLWQEGQSEPEKPTISFEDADAPPSGKPSIAGSPYAGTPIRYDDVKVWNIEKQ